MRNRSWLFLAVLVCGASLAAGPATAQRGGHSTGDQIAMISEVADHLLPEPYHRPSKWLDVGIAFPIGSFDDRDWDPGLSVRWSHEFLQRPGWSLNGSAGLNWNHDTSFNEAQTDADFLLGLGNLGPVDSRQHLGVPFSWELQLEPGANNDTAPFVSFGPGFTITRESLVRQDSVQVVLPSTCSFVSTVPSPNALATTRIKNRTKFHPGYVLRAGLRAKVGSGRTPLHARLIASWNVWYERGHPISMIVGALSFGR